jgi:hypothetical protein
MKGTLIFAISKPHDCSFFVCCSFSSSQQGNQWTETFDWKIEDVSQFFGFCATCTDHKKCQLRLKGQDCRQVGTLSSPVFEMALGTPQQSKWSIYNLHHYPYEKDEQPDLITVNHGNKNYKKLDSFLMLINL